MHDFWTNRKNLQKISEFLYRKLRSPGLDIQLQVDLIQILGTIKWPYAKRLAIKNMYSTVRDLRHRSVIVLEWVGNAPDPLLLNKRMMNDGDAQLRGSVSIAMCQIFWHDHPETKDAIAECMFEAVIKEEDPVA